MSTPTKTIQTIGPEDLRPDDYVTVTHTTYEFVSPFGDYSFRRTLEPVRVTCIPPTAGAPLRVVEACVPFVLVRDADGRHQTLDLRRHRLVRLDADYGRRAFKRLRKGSTGADD